MLEKAVEDDLKVYFIEHLNVESFVLNPITIRKTNRYCFSSLKSAFQGEHLLESYWFSLEDFCEGKISE